MISLHIKKGSTHSAARAIVIVMLALIIGARYAVPPALAQTNLGGPTQIVSGSGAATTPTAPAGPTTPAAPGTTNPSTAPANPTGAPTFDQSFACSITSGAGIANCFAEMMYNIMTLFAWLLGAVGLLFSATMYYTVVTYGSLVNKLTAITTAWGILRSLANMGLLFAFVLMGIATILDVEQYGVKRLLPKLLIAAVLLNFSLFVTKSIIDVGDTFAIQFYKELSTSGQGAQPSFSVQNEPISEAFMNATGLRSIYGGVTTPGGSKILDALKGSDSQAGIISLISLMGIILFLITTFILLALTLMFVSRAVTLIFLMISSPVGFISSAIPGLSGQGAKWWKALANNVLFAPIVMLCILISISMLQHGLSTALGTSSAGATQGAGFLTGAAPSTANIGEIGTWANLLLVFALAAGFMVASLVAARQLSIMGADFAMTASRKIVSYPFALGWRNTGGRAGAAGAKALQGWVGNQNKGRFGRAVAGGLKLFGADEAIYAGLKSASGAKVGGFSSYDDRVKQRKDFETGSEHVAEAKELSEALSEAVKTGLTEGLEKVAQKMSLHTLEETIKTCNEQQLGMLAQTLSPERFAKLMESKEISGEKQEHMQEARFGAANLKDAEIKNLTKKDQELFAKYFGNRFEDLLTAQRAGGKIFKESQLEDLQNNENLTKSQRANAKASSLVGRVDSGVAGKADVQALLDEMTGKQKAKLKNETLTNDRVAPYLKHNDIGALMLEDKLTDPERATIRDKILAARPNDRDMNNYFEKNKLAAAQFGWPGIDQQTDLLRQILNKLP